MNNIYTRNLPAVQPYLTISDHGFLAYVVLARAAWWRGLAPDIRAAMQAGLEEANRWVRSNAQGMNDEALAKLSASGRVQIHTLTPAQREALRAAFEPAYRGVAARLGDEFLNRVVAATRTGN